MRRTSRKDGISAGDSAPGDLRWLRGPVALPSATLGRVLEALERGQGHGQYRSEGHQPRRRLDRLARHRRVSPGRSGESPSARLPALLGTGVGRCWHSYTESAMPVYEYRCEQGHTFEVVQRMSDDPVTSCSTCEAPVQ